MLLKSFIPWIILSSIFLFILNSCRDGSGTSYIQNIDNRTNKTITILFLPGFNNTASLYGDTIVVPPYELKEILLFFDRGSNTPIKQVCGVYDSDPIEIQIEGGGNLTKSLTKDEDWEYEQNTDKQICTFVIEETDIQ